MLPRYAPLAALALLALIAGSKKRPNPAMRSQ